MKRIFLVITVVFLSAGVEDAATANGWTNPSVCSSYTMVKLCYSGCMSMYETDQRACTTTPRLDPVNGVEDCLEGAEMVAEACLARCNNEYCGPMSN